MKWDGDIESAIYCAGSIVTGSRFVDYRVTLLYAHN